MVSSDDLGQMKILNLAVVGAFAGGVAGALIGAATMFAVDVLNPMPAHAIDYEKCEAMNKMCGETAKAQDCIGRKNHCQRELNDLAHSIEWKA